MKRTTRTLSDCIPLSWQNPVDRFDVSNDSQVVPNDVLRIINRLNSAGAGLLPVPPTPPNFFDVNGDGFATSNDVLQLINFLNSDLGEGESQPRSLPCELRRHIASCLHSGRPTYRTEARPRSQRRQQCPFDCVQNYKSQFSGEQFGDHPLLSVRAILIPRQRMPVEWIGKTFWRFSRRCQVGVAPTTKSRSTKCA